MQSRTPLLLGVVFGLAGFLIGGMAAILGSIWVASRQPPRLGVGVLGEYATPYGFMGGLLGLAVGAWFGLRMGRRARNR
jgi:hypothetical protein